MDPTQLDNLINDTSNNALAWYQVLQAPDAQTQAAIQQQAMAAQTANTIALAQAQAAIRAQQSPLGSSNGIFILLALGLGAFFLMR